MPKKLKLHRWQDVKGRRYSNEKVAQLEDEVRQELIAGNLSAIREVLGLTQQAVAKRTKMAQYAISRLERRDDHLISTLRHYVEALGGELEIVARFGRKSVYLDV